MKIIDVYNGPSMNRQTVVHFCRLILRFILEWGESTFSDGNDGRAEQSVNQSTDCSPLPLV